MDLTRFAALVVEVQEELQADPGAANAMLAGRINDLGDLATAQGLAANRGEFVRAVRDLAAERRGGRPVDPQGAAEHNARTARLLHEWMLQQ